MDNVPWVSGTLTQMLVGYMEDREGGDSKMSYRAVLSSAPGYEKVSNARACLKDPHRWFPQSVFRDLIRQCEMVSGRKDVAHQAALHYFRTQRSSAHLQILVKTLHDLQRAFSYVRLWTTACAGLFRLSAIEKPGSNQELGIIASFDPALKPSLAAIGILRGNIEGFLGLYPGVYELQCLETLSQLRLEDLMEEFPNYSITEEPGRSVIRETQSGEVVAEAKVVYLKTEQLVALAPPLSREAPILPATERGTLSALGPDEEIDPQHQDEAHRAYQVTKGGNLVAPPLFYSLQSGSIYNAPYSRLRCLWKSSGEPMETKPEGSESFLNLLLDYLRGAQELEERSKADAREIFRLRRETRPAYPFGIVSQSHRMEKVFEFIRALSEVESTVLICGESGTGKELVAQAIHDGGARARKTFLSINCGALSESLLESELFGHEKGAFAGASSRKKGRFELAHGGTLFLDEIGELSHAAQVKLLRVLQEQEFERMGGSETVRINVRIIAATHRDILPLVTAGRFRQDLYYRLNVIQILLPPLRERKEDIPLLVQHFIKKSSERMNKKISGVTPEVIQLLLEYPWPGNIRELQNVLERAVVLASNRGWIGPDLLPAELTVGRIVRKVSIDDRLNDFKWHEIEEWLRKEGSLDGLLVKIQWSIVRKAVEQYQGNKTQAAAALKRTYRWLRKFETKAKSLEIRDQRS